MFPNFFRLIAAGGILIWSGFQFWDNYILNGIFFTLLAGLIILSYFKNELIIWALFQLRRNKIDKATKTLTKIKNPKTALCKNQQSYYFYLWGLISSHKDINQAEKFLKKALNLGLKNKYDIAMAKLSLAGIAMNKRRKREATYLLTEVKKIDKKGILKEQIQMMKQQLKKI